jgi:3-hydroxyacyl-[acyl-carrier-protein] dehydratase
MAADKGKPLVDFTALDLSRDVVSTAELRELVPQRETFELLDGICHLDPERWTIVGYKDWPADPWWASAHIPGKPLMPGVLMIEGAAQVATFLIKKMFAWGPERFIGLAGLDEVRFRGQVVPPARVHFVSVKGQLSGSRMARFPAQAFCNGQMVMEMQLLGVFL